MSEWGKAWMFKHPSPWDYMFFMNNALQPRPRLVLVLLAVHDRERGRLDPERDDQRRDDDASPCAQDGQMPSPVVLKVQFAPNGPAIKPMANATMIDSATAIVTWPVDVWFAGSRTFKADLNFGGRKIEKIVFDPGCRFPDHDPADNVWPRSASSAPAAPAGRGGFGGGAQVCGG